MLGGPEDSASFAPAFSTSSNGSWAAFKNSANLDLLDQMEADMLEAEQARRIRIECQPSAAARDRLRSSASLPPLL